MASFTLTNVQKYPNGQAVTARPVSNWPNAMVKTDAAPVGSATDTQTMTAGTLTFAGLTAGVTYVAHASVSSEHRYIEFIAGADVSDAAGGEVRPYVLATSGAQGADKGNVTTEETFATITVPANAAGARTR